MSTFSTFSDSCLEGAGRYSLSLGFWWHLPFLEEVKLRTLLHRRDNAEGLLISINVLEFVTVIINYCAAFHMVLTKNPTNNPYPVLLNVTNNASALSWTMGACHKSRIGRLLAHLISLLLINSPLGINSQWILMLHNAIVNDIFVPRLLLQKNTNSHHLQLFIPPAEVPRAESLLFLPPSARANLSHMGDHVDREVAMSQQDKEVETEATWQSHYIFWCSIIDILDPSGKEIGYQCIIALYTKFVMCSINYYNKDVFQSSTLWSPGICNHC
jgi:hypothetical protein